MIPDKIYIPLYPKYSLYGVHLGDDWMYEPHKECDNVTYIRKDALLEWINEMREKHQGFTDAEFVVTFDKLTEKINSF